MKTKLLTSALVLGLSSAAFAAPAAKPLGPAAPYGQQYRPDGIHRPSPMPVKWTSLSTASRIQSKQTINVGGFKAYSKLKLEATMGTTFIDKLVIVFGNGSKQVVELDKNLTVRNGLPMTIDLDGKNRRISKVVVYGKSGRRAALNVLAA